MPYVSDASPPARLAARLRRDLRRARVRGWVAFRGHYMLVFSGMALIIALAIGSGVFDSTGGTASQRAEVIASPTPAPNQPVGAPIAGVPQSQLVLTYFIVDTEEAQATMRASERSLVFREVLRSNDMEVLLVRNKDEEAAANAEIEASRTMVGGPIVEVRDLRSK